VAVSRKAPFNDTCESEQASAKRERISLSVGAARLGLLRERASLDFNYPLLMSLGSHLGAEGHSFNLKLAH
jgi:hypothetical protein